MKKIARVLGFDLSTTALSCGVRSVDGQEDFVSIPMLGELKWRGQPAQDVSFVPGMIVDAIAILRERGCCFAKKGSLSFSVRQHDMVLLDKNYDVLMPALSWQCNAAKKEAQQINSVPSIIKTIGTVEPRFILPKLLYVLQQDPDIADKVKMVMTTGDWIAYMLTNRIALSSSDALSNGLLCQKSRTLAKMAICNAARLFAKKIKNPDNIPCLFPSPIQSGTVVGQVIAQYSTQPNGWNQLRGILGGWTVIASLGDNHAGGVGCGLADNRTIVISAGTSGTVIRKCRPNAQLYGTAAQFEYYKDRLLLMMLADCAAWYDEFAWGTGQSLPRLDELAATVSPRYLRFWSARKRKSVLTGKIIDNVPLMAANAQFSIAIELLARVRDMMGEVKGKSAKADRFVLTGGLSRSPFFQEVITAGLKIFTWSACVYISDREGPLANQAATLGAVINAMLGDHYKNFPNILSNICPLKPAKIVDSSRLVPLQQAIINGLIDQAK